METINKDDTNSLINRRLPSQKEDLRKWRVSKPGTFGYNVAPTPIGLGMSTLKTLEE